MLLADHSAEGACYVNVYWRRLTALRLLINAHALVKSTTLFHRLDELSGIDCRVETGRSRFIQILAELDPPVLDAMRISTCFESLFKARLLLAGCVIHEVDRIGAKALAKEQQTKPIRLVRIKRREGHLGRRDNAYRFDCLQKTTLRWHVVVSEGAYRRRIGIPDGVFEALKALAAQRNTLHFLTLQVSTYSAAVFADLRLLRESVDRFVVGGHSSLALKLGFQDLVPLTALTPPGRLGRPIG